MSWASKYIEALQQGSTVKFRPKGNSMQGRIESGQLCTVAPPNRPVRVGDVVLCKVRGKQFLHLVSAVRGPQVQISNNRGQVNGWIGSSAIYGLLVSVEA